RVDINQTGGQSNIYLTVSTQNISVPVSGGRFGIDVKTNAGGYHVLYLPAWCKIENKYATRFTLTCDANMNTQSRSDWFKIVAGDKEMRINLTQSGSGKKSPRIKRIKCFNCPQINDIVTTHLGLVGDSDY